MGAAKEMAEDGNLANGHTQNKHGLQQGGPEDYRVNVVDGFRVTLLSVFQKLKRVVNLTKILIKLAGSALKGLSGGISTGLCQHLSCLIGSIEDKCSTIGVCKSDINVESLVGRRVSVGKADGVLTSLDRLDTNFGVGLSRNRVQLLSIWTLNNHADNTLGVIV